MHEPTEREALISIAKTLNKIDDKLNLIIGGIYGIGLVLIIKLV